MDDKDFQKVIFNKIRKLRSVDNVTLADTGRIIDAVFESIWSECACGGTVRIAGIGKFSTLVRKERNGRNPSTGEIMKHGESYRIKFSMFDKSKSRFSDDYTNKEYVNTNIIDDGIEKDDIDE